MSDDSDGQRQCRRGVTVDVELDAAMALADMAGVGPAGEQQQPPPPPVRHAPPPPTTHQEDEEEELASTRLSLELGKVGIQASPCSSSSSAGGGGHTPQAHHHHQAAAYQQQQQQQMPAAAPVTGYGPRPRHALTEAEKEAKRLRRVLANRESARQTILRRQAIRDELARKVADLSSQNENMKKEKDMVMQEYLSLKEVNKQLKEQVATRMAKKAPAAATAAMAMPAQQQADSLGLAASTASPPATPPRPGFLYTAAAPAPVPVPYVWGSWPPGAGAGYEHHHHHGSPPPPLCLQPCAWYYPVVADPRGSPSSAAPAYAPQPSAAFQDPRGAAAVAAAAEPVGSVGGSPAGSATGQEDTDDDPCSLTLGLDVVDKRSAPVSIFPAGPAGGGGGTAQSDRDKAATAAEARKRRKELTKLKHMHAARPGGEQW